MARMRGPSGKFGALLDSSMDRIADGAVFGAVAYYLAGENNPYGGLVAALICLVFGQVVSYVKARAQSLGLDADVGIAERLERLLIVGLGGLISGFGAGLGPARGALGAGRAVGDHGVPAADPRGPLGEDCARRVKDRLTGARVRGRLAGRPRAAAERRPGACSTRPPTGPSRRNGPGTQRLRRNLRQVVGPAMPEAELDALVRAGLRSYARYWMEAFRLPSQTREQFLNDFRVVQFDELKAVLGEGNGVILALPHTGNWDAAAAHMVSHGLPAGHGRRAAQAGGGLRAVHGVPGKARHGGASAHRGPAARRWTCSPKRPSRGTR